MLLYYFLTLVSVLCIAADFCFQKLYQSRAGTSPASGMLFNTLAGLFTAIFCYVANGIIYGFKIKITPVSLLFAAVFSICVLLYIFIGQKMMKLGTMAVYTVFLMSGGMILPYLFGVFVRGDRAGILRYIGLLVIVLGVAVSNYTKTETDKKSIKALVLFGVLIFILNGGCSISSNVNQWDKFTGKTVNGILFVMLVGICRFVFSGISFLFFAAKDKPAVKQIPLKGALPAIVLSAAVGGGSLLAQQFGSSHLDASVLYPLITGGSIVFSAIFARVFYKEKPTRFTLTGIALCVIGTCLFL